MKFKSLITLSLAACVVSAFAMPPKMTHLKSSKLTKTHYYFTCRNKASWTCSEVSGEYGENTSFGVVCAQDNNPKNRIQVDMLPSSKLKWTKKSLDRYLAEPNCSY
jgi:hypothetical protein